MKLMVKKSEETMGYLHAARICNSILHKNGRIVLGPFEMAKIEQRF